MAVFRVQKTQNYTIMSNHHLRNKALSLKSKGLLSLMLSLPEDWDYTTRGLASSWRRPGTLSAAVSVIKTARCAVWNIPCWKNRSPRSRNPDRPRLIAPNQNRQSQNGKNLYRIILHN